jgi:hypothetical protein
MDDLRAKTLGEPVKLEERDARRTQAMDGEWGLGVAWHPMAEARNMDVVAPFRKVPRPPL